MKACLPLLLPAVALLSACASGPTGEHLVRARFDCADGRKLHVTFNTTRELAVVDLGNKKTVELPSQRPGSGMRYKSQGYELRGAGDTLTLSGPGQPPVRCVQLQ